VKQTICFYTGDLAGRPFVMEEDDDGALCFAPRQFEGEHSKTDDSPFREEKDLNIAVTTMTMSGFRSTPTEEHLDQVKRIGSYLFKMKHSVIRIRTEETGAINPYNMLSALVEENHPALEVSQRHPVLNAEVQFDSDVDKTADELHACATNRRARPQSNPGSRIPPFACDQLLVGPGTHGTATKTEKQFLNTLEENIRERDAMPRPETAPLDGESKSGQLLGSPSRDNPWRVQDGTTPGESKKTQVHHLVYADKHDGRHKVRLRSLFRQDDTTSLLTKENSTSPNSFLFGSLGSDNFPRSFLTETCRQAIGKYEL
jgi:hypothetical protein